LALWSAAACWRLWDLQVVRHAELRDRATQQQQRDIEIEPPRGSILDARGRELAVSIPVRSAFGVPDQIADPAAAAKAIGALVGLDRNEVERLTVRLGGTQKFVWIARKLDPPVADALDKLELPGIHFLTESRRYYPMGSLAAHVLGFVGTDHRGLWGLEAHYEDVVAGQPGRRTVLRDARRGQMVHPELTWVEAEPGQDLRLTIDASVQMLVEQALGAAVERTRAQTASAVVMDIHTGAILAMATSPTFDPNHFGEVDATRWRNAVVADSYEPGSTFKIITVAAALEAGTIRPGDVFDCEMGRISFGRTVINDHKPFGHLDIAGILAKSSNVGAIKIGLRAGAERLHHTIDAFGFGKPTGIDLPGEAAGIFRPLERWTPLSKAYISFGQEISVTALQLARALAAVANGGRLVRPYVVARKGAELPTRPSFVDGVVSAQTSRELLTMIGTVIAPDGTGRAAALATWQVGGKTGTAQKAIDGRYSATDYVANFVGVAPLDAPRYVAVVAVDTPRAGDYHGGTVAAPVFAAMMEPALTYLGVRPSPVPPPVCDDPTLPLDPRCTPAEVTEAPLVAQLVAPALPLATPTAGTGIPDLRGLTARQVLRWASAQGVRVAVHGSGFVTRQQPLAGSGSSTIEVWLDPAGAWQEAG
jgi:cell division protein FtsI (penicillin-binding protein 3)